MCQQWVCIQICKDNLFYTFTPVIFKEHYMLQCECYICVFTNQAICEITSYIHFLKFHIFVLYYHNADL